MKHFVQLSQIPRSPDYDYCVIGGGPAGLIAAHELSRRGETLLLEAGAASPESSYSELRAATTDSVLVSDHGVHPANPWTLRGPGGGMERYAGILVRYRAQDFDRSAAFAHASADPRWPIGYEDLRPYYDEVERRFGIARTTGLDPTEPPSCAPLLPPHPPSARAELINEAFDELGIGHFPTPLGVNSRPFARRPACTRCGPCNETLCRTGAKASVLPLVLGSGSEHRLRLAHAVTAEALRVDPSGRVSAVECLDTVRGRHATIRARHFVIAAGALNSCALLLRSTSRLHPHGLANGNDQVGRGIQFKLTGYADVRAPASAQLRESPTLFSTTATTDFYHRLPGGGCGGFLYEASASDRPDTIRLHFVVSETPMAENSVAPAPSSADGPNVVIRHRTHRSDLRRLRSLRSIAVDTLARIGRGVRAQEEFNATGMAHLAGGCRAGTDPRTSVVGPEGRLHQCDNVYVADSAYFPYAAAANPTMTVIANALRISRQLAQHS
ncbi:GMC family oxidoreductase [Nocardiopsis sp. NPDC006198]|uniref:GMC family oxidoreductase n=1 Tax=Streptomonospora nanhaiensis TaxID=1323731 RepID=A0ABY6YFQ0_9ACTN|nr:GMC family oxidoreductase [Streptomonospora nanhaiensis]WAE71067.1 GMC family oxidoreductase [Streptomonospora nanhaiensis]